MPTFRHGDATLYCEEFGRGCPILTFAPAGLQSTIEVWSRPAAPINPTTECIGGSFPEATPEVLDAFYPNLYEPGFADCVDRAFVSACVTPSLILAGNDEAHPWPISEELGKLFPRGELVREWKAEPALTPARARAREFLAKHTPHA